MSEDLYVVGEICASSARSGAALFLSTDFMSRLFVSLKFEGAREEFKRNRQRQKKSRKSSISLTVGVHQEEDSHW
jgi:hypothetical protein